MLNGPKLILTSDTTDHLPLSINSKNFSILPFQNKQYVSVYVDNSSAYNIVVLQESDFTGILLGIWLTQTKWI